MHLSQLWSLGLLINTVTFLYPEAVKTYLKGFSSEKIHLEVTTCMDYMLNFDQLLIKRIPIEWCWIWSQIVTSPKLGFRRARSFPFAAASIVIE